MSKRLRVAVAAFGCVIWIILFARSWQRHNGDYITTTLWGALVVLSVVSLILNIIRRTES